MKKSATKCKLNNGFITSSDRNYSWRVAPQHCPLPLHPVIKLSRPKIGLHELTCKQDEKIR